jgi:glycosyltransferase A (GT-A) superfamily protein (DUF2064 family)
MAKKSSPKRSASHLHRAASVSKPAQNAIVVFTSSPKLDTKKFSTRLPAAARHEILTGMLIQTLSKVQGFAKDLTDDYDVVISSDDQFDVALAKRYANVLLRQRGSTFGEHLEHTISDTFAIGYQKIVIIGNDCPSLTAEDISKSFNFISDTSAVIGPAKDGGIYLVGFSRKVFEKRLNFLTLHWQAKKLFSELSLAFSSHGIDVLVLSEKQDMDTLSDLANFINTFDSSEESYF